MLLDYVSNSTLVFLSKVTFSDHFNLIFSYDFNYLTTEDKNVWFPKFRYFLLRMPKLMSVLDFFSTSNLYKGEKKNSNLEVARFLSLS